MLKTISSEIKMFERIHNGIEEAFVDVTKIRRVHDELFCTITIHDDDFSSKTVYQDVVYPSEIIKLI